MRKTQINSTQVWEEMCDLHEGRCDLSGEDLNFKLHPHDLIQDLRASSWLESVILYPMDRIPYQSW